MEFNITQRRTINEHMKDALINADIDFWRNLGPTVQAVMRESVQLACLLKPINAKITEEKDGKDSEGNDIIREYMTISLELYHPGLKDKHVLERKFLKSSVETW